MESWWRSLSGRAIPPVAWSSDDAPWHDRSFSFHYARTGSLGPGRARREARFLASLAPGGRAVDLGCGAGRTVIALARAGLEVLGVDIGQGALEIARRRSGGLDCRFECHDLRELKPGRGVFDLAYSIDGTMAGFRVEEAKKILRRVSRGLAPGGFLVLELPTIEMGEALDRRQDWYVADESLAGAFPQILLTEDFFLAGEDVYVHRIFSLDPMRRETRKYTQTYALYDRGRVRDLLRGTGLTLVDCLADFDGAAYAPGESHRMVVVTRRKT